MWFIQWNYNVSLLKELQHNSIASRPLCRIINWILCFCAEGVSLLSYHSLLPESICFHVSHLVSLPVLFCCSHFLSFQVASLVWSPHPPWCVRPVPYCLPCVFKHTFRFARSPVFFPRGSSNPTLYFHLTFMYDLACFLDSTSALPFWICLPHCT